MKITRDLTVVNKEGLHARPAMQLVECAGQYDCDVTITRVDADETTVADAKSVLQVITLQATEGTTMQLDCDGDDAEAAAEAIAALFSSGFGE